MKFEATAKIYLLKFGFLLFAIFLLSAIFLSETLNSNQNSAKLAETERLLLQLQKNEEETENNFHQNQHLINHDKLYSELNNKKNKFERETNQQQHLQLHANRSNEILKVKNNQQKKLLESWNISFYQRILEIKTLNDNQDVVLGEVEEKTAGVKSGTDKTIASESQQEQTKRILLTRDRLLANIQDLLLIINEFNKTTGRAIGSLTSSIDEIEQLRENDRQQNRDLHQINLSISDIKKEFTFLGDGWVSIFNGFQYKACMNNSLGLSWFDAREICHDQGGDLAAHGMENTRNRKILSVALNFDAISVFYRAWIGLSRLTSDRQWKWIGPYPSYEGAPANTSMWVYKELENAPYFNQCAYFNDIYNVLINPSLCSQKFFTAICEKPIL